MRTSSPTAPCVSKPDLQNFEKALSGFVINEIWLARCMMPLQLLNSYDNMQNGVMIQKTEQSGTRKNITI
jgi:hypothetical protein